MEETIRGVIEATVIRENNPRCQLNVTIQPFNTNFCLTPLINCTILGPLLIPYPRSIRCHPRTVGCPNTRPRTEGYPETLMVTVKALLDAGVPLSFIASAGTACLVEGEDEKIKIIQSPTWDELESSIASVQAVFNKRLVQKRRP